jgi:three-Cys-motif partner protein
MAQSPFGGAHTERKLVKLETYLDRYTTALKNQRFHLIYFDAFAGTGDIPQPIDAARFLEADEYQPLIVGSAERALKIATKFDEYIFVEHSLKKIDRLAQLSERYPALRDRITIRRGDGNAEVQQFCLQRDWQRCRAVVFLDPFGNQVEWDTIKAIAGTEAIDLWYLFPAGLGVHRQIGRDGTVHHTHEASLDRLLGTKEWRSVFIEEQPHRDLFGELQNVTSKLATPESITRYMIARMKTIFRGGVLNHWLPLGSNGIHMYSLVFAWANPSEKAKLAGRLADAVLRSDRRGRTK